MLRAIVAMAFSVAGLACSSSVSGGESSDDVVKCGDLESCIGEGASQRCMARSQPCTGGGALQLCLAVGQQCTEYFQIGSRQFPCTACGGDGCTLAWQQAAAACTSGVEQDAAKD